MALTELAILLASVVVLAKSSSIVVDSAVKLSAFFRISQMAIGFLLLAMTTTLPELSVSVTSSALGEGAIAAGNVFGSNIANMLLILGAGAFLFGFRINARELKSIGLVLLLTTVISAYILFSSIIQRNALGLPEGALLLAVFAAYIWHTVREQANKNGNGDPEVSREEALRAFLVFGAGIVIVIVSAGFVVESAVTLSRILGIAESFIGATVIAVGTSLPELSVGIQAIRKKKYGIALGDAIGATMVNLTLVLGVAAVLNPIQVNLAVFVAALLFAVIANIVLLYIAAVHKGMDRAGGALFLALYVLYLIVIFVLQFRELGT